VTRDVTFDETRKYEPNDLRPALQERVQEPLETIEFPDLELAGGEGGWKQRMKNLMLNLTVQSILTNRRRSR
jgi:Tfp pilus assembly protein PilP